MERNKLLKLFVLVMMLTAGFTACSKDEDYSDTSHPIEYSLSSMDVTYRGVWMVDDVKADTGDVRVKIRVKDGPSTDNKVYLTFHTLPLKAIVSKVIPDIDVNVAKIEEPWFPVEVLSSPDWVELMQTITDHIQSYNSLQLVRSCEKQYRCVGISQDAMYLEFKDVSAVYLPIVVITDTDQNELIDLDEMIFVTATIVPSKSKSLLYLNSPTFTSLLTVSQIEIVRKGEEKQIKTFSPEMMLKYTGYQTTNNPTVGN
jgi:hypothetical protein